MTTLYNRGTVYGDDGKLYVIKGKQRLLLAECSPEITIYERQTQVNAIGVVGHKNKESYCVIAICLDRKVYQNVDDDFIRQIKHVELYFNVLDENNGKLEIKLDNLHTDDLNYKGDWKFEADIT